MTNRPPELVVPDLQFPEALRWHDETLWFSDVFGGDVWRLGSAGAEAVAHVPGMPSGLGWLPDGSTLVVSCAQRQVLRIDGDGALHPYADLREHARFDTNDMVVDATGRAYVGNYGFDVDAGAEPMPTRLVRVDTDGSVAVESPLLTFPNGAVLVDGGRAMVVAETFADRLSQLQVAEDGHLHDARVLADLPHGVGPDGLDVDESGGVWVACAFDSAVVRVDRGGQVTERVEFPGQGVYCCVLGGPDGRTLFVALASTDEALAARERTGSIVAVQVDVPGVPA